MFWVWLTALAFAVSPPPGGWPIPPTDSGVTSVHDGDTLTLTTGDRVRLRWVNTPELRPAEAYAEQALAATQAFVGHGPVHLLLGSTNPRDGYGRVVAGIQTAEGNLSIHLLELGLAHIFVIPPDTTDLTPFIAAQERARAARLGIWSDERYQGALHITSFHANAPGEDTTNIDGEYLRICNVSPTPINLAGYKIARGDGKSWVLPSVVVPAGYTFELHSGVGTDQTDQSLQIKVHLQSTSPVWNDDHDRCTLTDPLGKLVDSRDSVVN